MENKLLIYIHGKGGNAGEAEHYKPLFPDCDVIGFDYKSQMPWEFCKEFIDKTDKLFCRYNNLILAANSIGAYFTMNALSVMKINVHFTSKIRQAFFISPIVNMERLILDMMSWANVTEKQLKEQKIVKTNFGENLSFEYLSYVRENPIDWNIPTKILYAEHDNLTSIETVAEFARKHNAQLTVMPGGEHWFHTNKQMNFLDNWIKENYINK